MPLWSIRVMKEFLLSKLFPVASSAMNKLYPAFFTSSCEKSMYEILYVHLLGVSLCIFNYHILSKVLGWGEGWGERGGGER